MTRTILVVEDDASLGKGIIMALGSAELELRPAVTVKEARQCLRDEVYDLVILDLNLPDGNGMELLEEIRTCSRMPVIILTANDMETDIVAGLESGADDYITKPFSLMVLRARVHAQLRKLSFAEDTNAGMSGRRLETHHLLLDFERMEFKRDGQPVELSKTEQKLLYLLASNPGVTLSRERLVDYVWTDGAQYVDENALSVAVKRLRDKLEDKKTGRTYIRTVYGIGYVWAVNEVE
ncbi:response regulator transcription factor [Ruminococcus gauvreauii]|uniref:Stage 0 sporulation protein A homolog n=1 Tax=Ruminococcus gauvreauii TaxID=438033 RepID=A0ABY5VKB3_9FIRM|nr:response regulator transcription factor [Ruminococcus gauvreauii]UWP60990.1 response regulator transcription factor [Ruminococcus gauvreauii]